MPIVTGLDRTAQVTRTEPGGTQDTSDQLATLLRLLRLLNAKRTESDAAPSQATGGYALTRPASAAGAESTAPLSGQQLARLVQQGGSGASAILQPLFSGLKAANTVNKLSGNVGSDWLTKLFSGGEELGPGALATIAGLDLTGPLSMGGGLVGAEEAFAGASTAGIEAGTTAAGTAAGESATAAAGAGAGSTLGAAAPYIGPAITAAMMIADLAQGKDPGQVFLHMNPQSDDLTKAAAAATTAVLTALGGPLGFALSGLIPWGAHTKGSHIELPGVAPGGFDTRTAGGTKTVYSSYREGIGALSPFAKAVGAAQTPEDLLAAFNQPWSVIPGQFRVESHGPGEFQASRGTTTGPDAFNFMNLGGTGFAPMWSPWTREALQDPRVIANLDVQAGMLGAPAEQPTMETALRTYLTGLLGTHFWGNLANARQSA